MGTEALANAGRKSQDVRDLNLQLEDIRKSNTELRDSRLLMRRHHDEEIVRMEREHEEKILFLLGQLNKDTPVESNDVSLNKDITDVEQRLKFQAEELNKMSELHDKLIAKDEECATLKLKLQRRSGNLLPIIHQGSPASLKKKPKGLPTMMMMNGGRLLWSREFFKNGSLWELDWSPRGRETALTRRMKTRMTASPRREHPSCKVVLARKVARPRPVPVRRRDRGVSQSVNVTDMLVRIGKFQEQMSAPQLKRTRRTRTLMTQTSSWTRHMMSRKSQS